MKQIKHLAIFFLISVLSSSLMWAVDVCGTTVDHDFTSSAIYSDTVRLGNGGQKSYYFNVPGSGTVKFSYTTRDSQINFYHSTNSCATTSSSTIANNTDIYFTSAAELYFLVTSGAANQDFAFTMTYTAAPIVSISCPSNSIVEGNTSNTTQTCTISLNTKPLSGDIQLTVQGVDVSASNGTDYTASSQNITFLQNTTILSQSYSFTVIGDTTYEANEIFNLRVINNPAYSSLTQPRRLPADYPITIVNDDSVPSLTISIGNTSINEGNVGTTPMKFPITLNAPATTDITVTYRFNNISTDSSDTNMTNGSSYSFIIPSGTDVGLYAATLLGVNGDSSIEPDETFSITLETTSQGVIDATKKTAIGTILNDDGSGGTIIIPAYNPGTVDTVDVYTVTGNSPFYQQVIKTKIAGQMNLTFDAIYLGLNAPFVPTTYTAANMPVMMYLYDPISGSIDKLYEQASPTTQLAAVIQTNTKWGRTPLFTMPATAKEQAYILMRYLDYNALLIAGGPTCLQNSSTGANAVPGMPSCVASNVQYLDAFHQEAFDRCKVQHGEPCKPSFHGYSGGGNPAYPGYDPEYDHKYGCYECTLGATPLVRSVDNFTIRPANYNAVFSPVGNLKAGNDFNLTLIARSQGNTPITGYDGNANIAPLTQITSCQVPDGNLTNSGGNPLSARVFNGVDTNVSNNIKFGDVGVFDMNVTDSTWTAVDFVKNECILNSNATVPDANGKVGCLVRTTFNPVVIPDHFGVVGGLLNGSNDRSFTYLSNFELHATDIDRNISASLDLNVSALAAGGRVTSNYTSMCYAKDGNLTLTLSNPIIVNPAGSLNKMLWYHYTPNSNGSFLLDEVTTQYQIPYLNTYFDSNETNGTAEFNYKINFDRNVTREVNPFMVIVNDINATDTDNVNGVNSLDSNATFLFGRTHAARQRYYDTTAPYQGVANIYFESFCFGALCDKALLPNGINSTRTDDVRWYVIPNPFHTTPTDGSAGTVSEKASTIRVTATAPTVTNPSQTTLTYTGTSFPYKTTMQNSASPWLIQNETNANATTNEFQVEFDLSGDWTGEHETNTTTKSTGGVNTNRRIMW